MLVRGFSKAGGRSAADGAIELADVLSRRRFPGRPHHGERLSYGDQGKIRHQRDKTRPLADERISLAGIRLTYELRRCGSRRSVNQRHVAVEVSAEEGPQYRELRRIECGGLGLTLVAHRQLRMPFGAG